MNNKKVFSFHMFLQTLKQTRLAGFIMMAVITLISVVPIISSLSYIKEYKQSELVKLDIYVNNEPVDALSFIVHKSNAYAAAG